MNQMIHLMELLLKVNDNNEKIEVLDLQNKRISSEIVSVDSNIANLEDIKKSQVMKKQFKDAQNTNNEIKKCKESKQSITELLNGNKDEIRGAQLASIRQMSGQVSCGSAGEYQADERAGVARLSWRVSGR